MSTITDNINKLRDQIRSAAATYQRSADSIKILAVSKTHPASAIAQAHEAGLFDIGENYLQEALEKQAQLTHLPLTWHFLGPVQSNKTKAIAENFTWVHTVDRLKVAQRLSAQRPAHLPPLNICVQVNISQEATKSGCAIDELTELASAIQNLDNVTLRGLMIIPQPSTDFTEQRAAFRQTNLLMQELNQQLGLQLDTLSMGMSNDLEAAIAEGATCIRIGTAIFGQRN
ncbi:MAG: YggS family pyridoxal phosphate-dependent enzyme [Gammaproteobacteria bacterium]|nr:YggS family pyridoxal phosphate-dependent enzyme [Gammaproteobacteria bacterium]